MIAHLVFGNTKGNIGFYNIESNTTKMVRLPTEDRVSTLKYHPEKNTVFISKDLHGYALKNTSLVVTKIKGFQTIKSLTVLDNQDLLLRVIIKLEY